MSASPDHSPQAPAPVVRAVLAGFPTPVLALIAALLGALNVTAFAPLGWWPVQMITLACASYWLIQPDAPRRCFQVGLAFGFGWMASGIYWLYVSLHFFGGLNPVLSVLAVALLALYMALYPGLAFAATSFLVHRWQLPPQPDRSKKHSANNQRAALQAPVDPVARAAWLAGITPACTSLLVFPACWALTEWLRGWVLTGFPWLSAGYAHVASPLNGFAPIAGVYGVSFFAMLSAGLLALAVRVALHFRRPRQALFFVILLATLYATGYVMHQTQWTRPTSQPVSVDLAQGNVPQEFKFSRDEIEAALSWYLDTIKNSRADLIATPETAIPVFPQELNPATLQSIAAQAADRHQVVVVGVPTADYHPFSGDGKPPENVRNAALVFNGNPALATAYTYSKAHLVPFGEFIPPGFHWFVAMLNIPLGDLSRGNRLQPAFAVKDQWVLPNICYEDLFGEEIAYHLRHASELKTPPATILLNMSNIAWFGNTFALPQHLQISRMRALETGRPMLRSTNTGATAVINPRGDVVKLMPYYTRGTLHAEVQGYTGNTPYILFGNTLLVWLAIFCLIIACAIMQYGGAKNINKS